MGIINVTPDSFFDGGLYASTESAIRHAIQLIKEGADILDIGGESTRPGSVAISTEEELCRVLPVVRGLVRRGIPISVDTSKPEVMHSVIEAGAVMINDINALQEPGALEVISVSGAVVCLMHKQGDPHNMQINPRYNNVITEVTSFLRRRLEVARIAGIRHEQLVIDPGFGFGKRLEHNLELLRCLDSFLSMGVPMLVGLSHKSMLQEITENKIDNRIHASVAAALLAAMKGAKILRVHDVKATKDALAVYNSINTSSKKR